MSLHIVNARIVNEGGVTVKRGEVNRRIVGSGHSWPPNLPNLIGKWSG